jgi:hypothetical protein
MEHSERPVWPIVLMGAFLYAIASALRHYLLPQSVGGVFSVALLFLILLAPGALVGYFRPRRVLEFGFIAGVIGDVAYRLGDLLHAGVVHAAVSSIPSSAVMGSIIDALPVGILSAAGGAFGYVLRTRRNSSVTSPG